MPKCRQMCLWSQVIKIGTSSLVNFQKKSFNIGALAQLCEAVRNLRDQGEGTVELMHYTDPGKVV